MTRKAFTVAEANALIPVLEGVLSDIDGCKAEMRGLYDKIQVLDLLWGRTLLDRANPDHAEAVALRGAVEGGVRTIEEKVRDEILARGLRFPQGGLEHGMVDFPTTWEGRWVYLCWQRGEPSLQAWHEVDAGFAGRRELTVEQERRMGREDDPSELDDSMLDC